ncbi:interleukin-1 receptor-associated kinase 4-like isoform X1 [Daphnia pulicaria]|uniref:interleukin-1 receptor-associated kinase 4-like isoform X1 n=1 Tax=Daphnia pulicaria TaxID=35523 RepID=UPI001EEA3982|nr:interleukin-1 receptor-associated kinase 4-like isoform X1 [Daphnia pulicaria]
MNSDMEIRKMPITVRLRLSSMLDINNSWKIVMGAIPKLNGDVETKKFSSEHVGLIEEEAKRQKKSAFDILIDEWGTSGKQRPTVCELVKLLAKLELYQAADYLSTDLLGEGPVERPANGPSANVPSSTEDINFLQTTSHSIQAAILEATNEHINPRFFEKKMPFSPPEVDKFDTTLPHLSYTDLEYLTNDFDLNPVSQGRKLGAGAFGTVFLGMLKENPQLDDRGIEIYKKMKLSLQHKVAVKRLHNQKVDVDIDTNRLFRTEVETMSQYVHENLLALLAFSADGPDCCLVYSFIPNGSLEARLACEGGSPPLQWNQRLDVAHGVSKALIHLHTGGAQPLVHRDVKSANVLLDHNMKAKLGDFGLIRIGASGRGSKSVAFTSNVLGTSAYMAPEAFRGDISVKLDTFSFGVIILELLTGLPPYDEERDGNDLISHVDSALDEIEFIQLLDPKISPLPEDMASALHSIALSCIQEKKRRPLMTQVYAELLQIDQSGLISM